MQIRGWTMAAASDRGAGAGRAGATAPRDVPDAVERQLPHRDGFVTFGGTHGDVSTEGLAGPPSRWSSIGPGLLSFSHRGGGSGPGRHFSARAGPNPRQQ